MSKKLLYLVVSIFCSTGYILCINNTLDEATNALLIWDFNEFKKVIKNRKKGLLEDLAEVDDLKNAKLFFETLGIPKKKNDFTVFLSQKNLDRILFDHNDAIPIDFKKYHFISDNQENNILHYIAQNIQLGSDKSIDDMWTFLLIALLESASEEDTNKKNKLGKTYLDVIQERIDKSSFDLLLTKIKSARDYYYKEMVWTYLELGFYGSAKDILKHQDPDFIKKVFSGASRSFYSKLAQKNIPLLHRLVSETIQYESALEILKEYPQLADIVDTNGNNLLHIVSQKKEPLNPFTKQNYNDLLQILSHNPVDLNVKNNSGQTPLDIAKIHNPSAATFLQNKIDQNQKTTEALFNFAQALNDI